MVKKARAKYGNITHNYARIHDPEWEYIFKRTEEASEEESW